MLERNLEKAPSVQTAIDPHGTLPEVILVPRGGADKRWAHGSGGYDIHAVRRNLLGRRRRIGGCQVVSNARTRERWFSNISVEKY